MESSFQCDQVLWVRLTIMKDREDFWVDCTVDGAVVQAAGVLARLSGTCVQAGNPYTVVSSDHACAEHHLQPSGVWHRE